MAFPEEHLLPDEKVLHESGLHWIGLFKEILYTLAFVSLWILFVPIWSSFNSSWLMWPLFVAWLLLSAGGAMKWFSTRVAVTSRRIVVTQGIVKKAAYEIPIDRIQDVAFRQKVIQRMVGSGDILVETSASSGRTRIGNVPDPEGLKRLITNTREERIDSRHSPAPQATPPAQPASGPGRVEQLDMLSRLHTEGKLTDEEFEAEKRRILGS